MRRIYWIHGTLAVLAVLFAIAPILSVLVASAIASANDCTLNEAGAHPCEVFGVEVGETLVGMFVAGWLTFLTVPVGFIALAVVGVSLAISLSRASRRARNAPPPPPAPRPR